MANEIKVFSPATVANVSCGFDVLGFCLDTIGDEMIVKKVAKRGVRITKIKGYNLPLNPLHNVAGVAALALLEHAKPDVGFEIEIYKNIKPGSGIGSSSASASGSVFAINELLGKPYNLHELTAFAMKGEVLASGTEHADNIAPALFGGFTLVKSSHPNQVIKLPVPSALYASIIHPQIEIKTREAREILPDQIPLKMAITQWANVGCLVHALHTSDYQLLRSALQDVVIEPYRKTLIPHFDVVKKQALKAGALGCGISGSGPSIFTLCEGLETALTVEKALREVYTKTNINFNTYISKINPIGIKIL